MKKGELSRQRLIEGLFFCLGEYGIEATTFQKVADHCGVSQTLVVKTFKNREELIWTAFTELIRQAVEETVSKLESERSAFAKLEDYFQVSLDYFQRRKQTAKIYVLLYYLSSVDPKYLAFNSKLKEVAVKRVSGILEEGIARGEFEYHGDIGELAKVIHSSLTGMLINSVTEVSEFDVRNLCRSFLEILRPAVAVASEAAT